MDIKIDFERGTNPYLYKDALYFTEEQFDALTPEEIEAMKDERYNNWYDMVTNPPPSTDIPVENTAPSAFITIGDENYQILNGTPPSGAKLIEVNGTWYIKVN